MKKLISLIVILVFLWSCQTKNPAGTQNDAVPATFSLSELWATDTVMKTPESVLYDPQRDVLYVANMNRTAEGDATGFISKLSTDGSVIDLHWISGLNEPRGMGLHGNRLFATDSDRLLVIDPDKGEVVQTVPVEGSRFLNDLAVGTDGVVWFTDSETGIVHTWNGEAVGNRITGLERPNGLYDAGDHMIVSVSGAGEIRKVNKESLAYDVLAEGVSGDGVEYSGAGDYYIVSEWSGRIVVIGNDTIQTILDTREQKISSADIGYHPGKMVVYVPTFFDNRVVAYQLKAD